MRQLSNDGIAHAIAEKVLSLLVLCWVMAATLAVKGCVDELEDAAQAPSEVE